MYTAKETRLQYNEGQAVKLLFSTDSYITNLFYQLVSRHTIQKVYKSEPLIYCILFLLHFINSQVYYSKCNYNNLIQLIKLLYRKFATL